MPPTTKELRFVARASDPRKVERRFIETGRRERWRLRACVVVATQHRVERGGRVRAARTARIA